MEGEFFGMKERRVNILLVNYNSEAELATCLPTLQANTYPNTQIFIVDNDSTPFSKAKLKEVLKSYQTHFVKKQDLMEASSKELLDKSEIVLVENDTNSGYAPANNIVLRYLLKNRKDEFVGIMNPDLQLTPGVISDLVALAANEKTLAGNVFYDLNEKDKLIQLGGVLVKTWVHGVRTIKEINQLAQLDSLHGSAIFTHLNTFREVGLLPEDYFLYWEETDFCFKARSMGYQLAVNRISKIYDQGGTEQTHRFIPEYLYILNGLKFYSKYKRMTFPFVYLSVVGKWLLSLLKGERMRSRAIYLGMTDYLKYGSGSHPEVRNRIQNELVKLAKK